MSPLLIKISKDFATLWTTIDPIGNVALFAGLTALLTPERTASDGAACCDLCHRSSSWPARTIGQVILDAIGIHMHSLKVAGGIILFLFGVQMLFGKMDKTDRSPEEGRDLAVFPLAVPSIAGPGAMMAVIVLTDNDVYTVPQRFETGVVLAGGALHHLSPAAFFGCDSAGDRSTGCVRPRPRNGTHPWLSGSGNRANCAGCRPLERGGGALGREK